MLSAHARAALEVCHAVRETAFTIRLTQRNSMSGSCMRKRNMLVSPPPPHQKVAGDEHNDALARRRLSVASAHLQKAADPERSR